MTQSLLSRYDEVTAFIVKYEEWTGRVRAKLTGPLSATVWKNMRQMWRIYRKTESWLRQHRLATAMTFTGLVVIGVQMKLAQRPDGDAAYRRVVAPVHLESGLVLEAFVYQLNR